MYLLTAGQFAGISARLSFWYVHSTLLVELLPVFCDLASGIVERHGDGLKKKTTSLVNKRKLHEFGTIDGFVVGQKKIVVRTATIGAGIHDGQGTMGTLYPSDEIVAWLLTERVYRRDNYTVANGFDDTVAIEDNSHMIYHAGGHISDGVALR